MTKITYLYLHLDHLLAHLVHLYDHLPNVLYLFRGVYLWPAQQLPYKMKNDIIIVNTQVNWFGYFIHPINARHGF